MRSFQHRLLRMALATSLLIPQATLAQSGPKGASRPLAGNQHEKNVYLRFVGRTWDDVLKSVAQQAGHTLVMPDVPAGRLTRYDHAPHTLEESLRILNHELDSTGYQIMAKGDYLLVLRDDRFRPEYSRTVIEPTVAEEGQASAPTTWKQSSAAPAASGTIEPAEWQDPADASQDRASSAIEPVAKPLQEARQAVVVEPEQRDSVWLTRAIYQAYGKQARLIQQGPLGLPAFEVELPAEGKRPARSFTIGIDKDQNQIVLVAGEQEQAALLNVIETLDASPEGPASSQLRLLAATPEIHKAATRQLPRVLAQITEQNQADAPPDPSKASTSAPAPAQPGTEPAPSDLNSILDRLRGDVSIEALNELGLLILRGNEQDVEGVMQIVRAIEQLSVGTTPEIHLRHLENVNSEALSTLLNSVYESVQNIDRRASRANRRVNVLPVVQPNSLLIIAPSQELESILALIDELDQPLHPGQQVKVFHLKNTTSAGAVTVLREFYQERGGLGTRLRVSSDTRTNTLVVQATPKDLEEIAIVIRDLDKDESHAISRLQLFPLKNAVAEELATFINTALEEALNPRVSTQFGTQQQQAGANQPKSFVLEFLAGSGSQAELMRSGILADVRVSADPRTNSLAVIAPERSLPLFAALIAALDKPADAVAEVKVFTLTHADAAASLTLLQELFNQTTTANTSQIGVNLAGTADTGSSLLPIRFSVDVRSNSILAIGGADALTIVEAILLRLDNEAPRKRVNIVLRLKNSPATDVANAINQFLTSQRELSIIDPELVSSYEQIDREVIVVPEVLSNNLLISATPEYYAEVLRIAKELDAAPAQVIIQALLVEVQLDNLDEFGIELGFQDSVLFNRSVIDNIQTITNTVTNQNIQTTTQQIVSQEGSPGFLFNSPVLGNNTGPASNPAAVGSQGLSGFGLGRVNGDLGYGGLVLSASSESVSVLIRALAQQRNVQVLSRPQIRTVDSQQAQIQVGQRVPIVNGVNITGTGVANPNIEYDEAGIILSVTPRINPDGQIVMEVLAERSAYRGEGVPIFTDATTGNTIVSPIKDISVARATVGVSDGQTIVLGGMISETDTATTRKVPWLGDIPVVGRLFRYDQSTNTRTELLIFLTPRILHHDGDNELIKEIEAGRIHFFYEEAEELHGPLFGVPVGDEFLPEPFSEQSRGAILEEQLEMHTMPLPREFQEETPEKQLPLSPPSLLDDSTIPRTIVPDDSLKPMSLEKPASPQTQASAKATSKSASNNNSKTSKPKSGVTRVFR